MLVASAGIVQAGQQHRETSEAPQASPPPFHISFPLLPVFSLEASGEMHLG